MEIRYYGHSCFALIGKDGTSILTDPYTKVGYELPAGLSADALTISHGHFDHCFTQAIAAKQVINGSGKQAENIVGIDSYHDPKQGALRGRNIIYKITVDGITFCHMGDLGESCSNALLQAIGKVDVLLIPVGGTYTIDAVQAKEYVDKINPKTVIPMHYKPSDGALDIQSADEFLGLFSEKEIERVPNGKIEYLLEKQTKRIIYMERIQ